MNKFIGKLLAYSLPCLLGILIYAWSDPFKVVWNYDRYVSDVIIIDRGFESTKVYLDNRQKYSYDSFIFGSSRSCAYTCSEWSRYLGDDCLPFSFGAWNESITGIARRIRLIDSLGGKIKNALLIIDSDHTFQSKDFHLDHYKISGSSLLEFHSDYLLEYLSPKHPWLVPASVDYRIFHKQRPYMKRFMVMTGRDLDPVTNDWFPYSEKEIMADSIAYYKDSMDDFFERPEKEQEAELQITSAYEKNIKAIAEIFNKDHTQVKVVVSPLYDQIKLNERDYETLGHYFGEENIYDFSGKNIITQNMYNYKADVIHYRKRTANRIFRIIYQSKGFRKYEATFR